MSENNKKWRILIPRDLNETERCAAYDLFGIVDSCLPYPLAMSDEGITDIENCDENLIIIGTSQNGGAMKQLAKAGHITLPSQREGYAIRAMKSPFDGERFLIIICGADAAGLLYAVHAFDLRYIRDKCRYNGYHYNHRHQAFIDAMPEWEFSSYPKTDRRGIWTWGHVIYDYRAFLYNMSALGMNHIIIWNDFVPLNAADVIAEAHRRAIKVYWGFSCSWGEKVDPNDPSDVEKWTNRVLEVYRDQYAPLTVDGIYFQAFTETTEKKLGERSIAELVTDWANSICGRLREVYPELDIEFGVHAISIGQDYAKLAGIDPNIAVMWEDCGDFPYYYDPARQAKSKEAIEYTRALVRLQGDDTRFAAVLKGFTVLNWSKFEHYHGPIVLGESPRAFIERRADDRRFTWNYARPYWIEGAELLREYFSTVVEAGVRETTITALIEDGCFERIVDPSVTLFAQLMWDCEQDLPELIRIAEHSV